MSVPNPNDETHPDDALRLVFQGEVPAYEVVVRRFEWPLRAWLATQAPPGVDVSPLKFHAGLKSHTIRVYDITMESPGALELEDFQIYMFDEAVESRTMLEETACTSRSAGMKFRGLVVGIDLSDLGYEAGARVDGLFFQDALDDDAIVDPVFIGGLPGMEGSDP